ncbi:DMT family transporter [Motilimonas eburnea]|uniref:DMT family transporter n=1 Tax=Motilimonas eburnea TaxID=1737488 RepID=UPI001E504797|nr:multidrug efflux SMR transporter [Motilimonas eburnea]MCE2570251.1 multidrug efflux SMR transporter [Motilimonas eburnea]
MTWFILLLAGLSEIAWAVGLKLSNGFSHPWISLVTVFGCGVSLLLLALALKSLPLSVAYGIWVGIGVIGSAVAGFYLFNEPITTAKLVSLLFILIGIIGLKLGS